MYTYNVTVADFLSTQFFTYFSSLLFFITLYISHSFILFERDLYVKTERMRRSESGKFPTDEAYFVVCFLIIF